MLAQLVHVRPSCQLPALLPRTCLPLSGAGEAQDLAEV